MTIALTGATGQLGSLVVEALLRTEKPESIVAVVRDRAKASPLSERGVQVRVADYTDRAALTEALRGVDRLLLISSPTVGQREAQHANVIDAASAAGVPHIVYTSATRATTSDLVLAPEHKATEQKLAESGLQVTLLRNNWYHENFLGNVEPARHTGVLLGAAAEGRVASAARRDYADAAAAVLVGEGHEGRTYELGAPTSWDYDDLAAALSEVVGREVVHQRVSAEELVAALTAAGLDEGTARFVAAIDQNIADGALDVPSPELEQLIGRPITPLAESLRG